MESKRNLLKSLDSLEELLVLEEESSGNLSEAAEIAKSVGDNILREIDLLEMTGQCANASLLIISYVLSNSLWISGNQWGGGGWPLKSFPQKVQLLNRAMLDAEKVSETFYGSICAEAKILSYDDEQQRNLSELVQCYSASKQYNTPTGEILSVRKLLDAHLQVNPAKYEWDTELHLDTRSFDERIPRNQVSGGTLVYLWNLWKVFSLEMAECLESLYERRDFIKFEGIIRFCFNYFGVRLPDNISVAFQLMNPGAAWIRNVDEEFVRKNRKVMTLEVSHFASAARKYWHQELVCVALRVLEALQELYKSSVVKCWPNYCQSVCLLHIFDIAKFFLESKSINTKNIEARKLQDFLQLSTKYIELVFPLDPRESLSENMICLRETELSKNLLEEIVSININTRSELTYGQIGRSVMIMLGTSKPMHGPYDRIARRRFSSKDTSWKSFIEILRATMEPDSPKESKFSKSVEEESAATLIDGISLSECVQEESALRCALSRELHKALEETFKVHWRTNDYLSPNCFFYLVERLMILVPHSQGHFFTTKSSFVEYLLCLPSDANPRASFVTNKESYSMTIKFVTRVVQQCLKNSQQTAEWIDTCGIDCKYYFPELILRLVMILCLSCLNKGFKYDILLKLLHSPQIKSMLPIKFYEALRSRRQNDNLHVSAVAGAFQVIGDPVVIVASSENNLKFTYPDAIFLDLKSFSSRNEILKSLFPARSLEASHNQPIIVKRSEIKSLLQVNWGLICETSKALESLLRNRNDGNLKSLVLIKKVEVKKHIQILTSAAAHVAYERFHSDEDKNLARAAASMIMELDTISDLLNTSDLDNKALSEIVELIKSLEARRPQLDKLLSLLTVENDPKGIIASEEIDDNKISDSSNGIEDRKNDDSAGPVTDVSNQDAECSQAAKGRKKKKNKKPKNGKGRRRK